MAENLRLAQDHRIQSAGHAEHMSYRLAIFVAVKIRSEVGGFDLFGVGYPIYQRGLVVAVGLIVKFGAIASG